MDMLSRRRRRRRRERGKTTRRNASGAPASDVIKEGGRLVGFALVPPKALFGTGVLAGVGVYLIKPM
jgi:hypothetical protein